MRWVLGMKELARIRECVKIGEIFFGLKEKRGCKGERGDGREGLCVIILCKWWVLSVLSSDKRR